MDEKKYFTYKEMLRKALIAKRALISDSKTRSETIIERVFPMLSGNVMIYLEIGSECAASPLFDMLIGKNAAIFAPFTKDGIITPKRLLKTSEPDRIGNLPDKCYGEPCDRIDVTVTPLLGYNERGFRLGYGKGCYDRFFASHDTYKIGLAFDCQFAEFDEERHDIPLDCIVTETGILYY